MHTHGHFLMTLLVNLTAGKHLKMHENNLEIQRYENMVNIFPASRKICQLQN